MKSFLKVFLATWAILLIGAGAVAIFHRLEERDDAQWRKDSEWVAAANRQAWADLETARRILVPAPALPPLRLDDEVVRVGVRDGGIDINGPDGRGFHLCRAEVELLRAELADALRELGDGMEDAGSVRARAALAQRQRFRGAGWATTNSQQVVPRPHAP
jgi:hypothetical protein